MVELRTVDVQGRGAAEQHERVGTGGRQVRIQHVGVDMADAGA
jgi:hypothetical protein